MNKAIGGFVVCVLGLVACNVEHYDDCMGDSFDYGDDVGGGTGHGRAGSTSISGKASSDGGETSSGASAGSTTTGGTASGGVSGSMGGTSSTAPQPCDEESDCSPGFNCDLEQQVCVASDEETCGELKTEAACTHRIRSANRVVTACVALSQARAHGRAEAEADARGARGMGEASRAVA